MARRQNEHKRQEWVERLARYRTSDLTVAAFCARERVSVNTFYYWARRVDSVAPSRTLPSAQRASSPAVVTMSDRARQSSDASPELTTSSTRRGEVRFHFDAAVEVSVPAECLDVIRCLVDCVGRQRVERDAAFREIIVAPR